MSKSKSITDLVTELQQENESLKGLERLANQYTKMEFQCTVKELHDKLYRLEMYERKARERDAARQGQQAGTMRSE